MSPRTIASLSRVDRHSEAPQTADALIAAFLSSIHDAAPTTVTDHRAAARHFLYWIHQQGLPIRLTQTPTKCRVHPVARIKLGKGWRFRGTRYSEQGTERVERVETPIEAERKLVEVGL